MFYVQDAFAFIVETVFGLFILAVLLRFLFQLTRADFRNPISQIIVRITNPLLAPLRRVIPGVAGIDMAAVVLILLIGFLKTLILAKAAGGSYPLNALFVISVAETLNTVLWIFIIAVLIVVVASWVAPHSRHPALMLTHNLAHPVVSPFRRLIPAPGGLDFSPLIALLLLQLLQKLIVAPLFDFGRSLL
ncbi:MAG: YggT family protein [Pseudomonadota bacterium]